MFSPKCTSSRVFCANSTDHAVALGVFKYIHPSLPEDLVVPVLVYCLVIATMAHRSLVRSSDVVAKVRSPRLLFDFVAIWSGFL